MNLSVKQIVSMPAEPRILFAFCVSNPQTSHITNTSHRQAKGLGVSRSFCILSKTSPHKPAEALRTWEDPDVLVKTQHYSVLLPPTESETHAPAPLGDTSSPTRPVARLESFVGEARDARRVSSLRSSLWGHPGQADFRLQAKWHFVSTQLPRLWGNSACLLIVLDLAWIQLYLTYYPRHRAKRLPDCFFLPGWKHDLTGVLFGSTGVKTDIWHELICFVDHESLDYIFWGSA